ncbi:MAG TPA: PAS domain S-box protein, partial [Blastocatellia bacterium]|nr:PAS domain S-box protein [Blastocatellia bacterium]
MIKLDLTDHAKADLPDVPGVPSDVEPADETQVGGESLFKAIRGALAHNDRTDLRGFGVFLVKPRKQVERTMSLLAAVVQSSSEAIVAATLDGQILSWNPGAESLFGYSANEVVGQRLPVLAVADEHPDILRALKRVSRGENIQVEATGIRKDGHYVRVSFCLSPIRGKDGEAMGVAATVHDITKLEMREERLRERAEHFTALVDRSTHLVSVLESDGLIRYVNSAATAILGYEPSELIRTNLFDQLHPDDVRVLARALRGDASAVSTERLRFRVRHRDGSWRTLQATCRNLLSDEAVEGFLVNARDVTERARDDDETQAKRTFKASQDLAGDIAADFLQLLGKIHAHSDRILRNLDGNDVLRIGADEVKSAASAASLLARQLLAFGKKQ